MCNQQIVFFVRRKDLLIVTRLHCYSRRHSLPNTHQLRIITM